MGDIGKKVRTVEFEPAERPAWMPEVPEPARPAEPAVIPAAPEKEKVPA